MDDEDAAEHVDLAFATQAAAPSKATSGASTTCTGIFRIESLNRPLAAKRSRKGPYSRRGRILGAMPPPRNTPPTARAVRAMLPAAAPYRDTNRVRDSSQMASSWASAACDTTGAGSPSPIRAVSHAGSGVRRCSLRKR